MRGTEVIEYRLNYGGVYSDTSKLSRDIAVNNHNISCVEQFLRKIKIETIRDRYMASNVSKFDVADLIRKLKIPYVNKKFDTEGLSEYVENSDLFPYWDVVIATGAAEDLHDCFGIHGVKAAARSFHVNGAKDPYIRIGGTNNRVLDPGIFDCGLWLTEAQREFILQEKEDNKGDTLSAIDYLRKRKNPIFVIYPIELKTEVSDAECQDVDREVIEKLKKDIREEVGNITTPLVAFAFGFPEKESSLRLKYRANIVKLDELNGNLEIDDDGEGEEDMDD